MYTKKYPVYNIQQFQYPRQEKDFYVSAAAEHLKKFSYVLGLHKHDHYLTIVCTRGQGTHEIDFISYKMFPGAVHVLSPGQTHELSLSEDIEGFVLLHSKDFYELNYATRRMTDYPFFCSGLNSPEIILSPKDLKKVAVIFKHLIVENREERLLKNQVLCALVDMLYILLTRLYVPRRKIDARRQVYLEQLLKFEELVDLNFKTVKSPAVYAGMLGITIKHLNRICNICIGKTTSELITDRVLLEAKRMLAIGTVSVENVAIELGYFDPSHFSRLFKKHTGVTPLEFLKKSNNRSH